MSEKNATRIVKRWWYNWICRTNFCSTKCQTSTCLTKCYSSDKTRVHKLFEYCNTCPTKGKSVTRLGREMITSSTFITNTVINKSSAGIYEVKCICTDKQNSRYVSWHCIPREATSNPPRRIPLKENNLSTPQKKKPPERRHPRKKTPQKEESPSRQHRRTLCLSACSAPLFTQLPTPRLSWLQYPFKLFGFEQPNPTSPESAIPPFRISHQQQPLGHEMLPPLTDPLESDIFQGPELATDERTEELARSQHIMCSVRTHI